MAHYHSWAGFVFANGIKLESDMGFFCHNNNEKRDLSKQSSSTEEPLTANKHHSSEGNIFFIKYFDEQ